MTSGSTRQQLIAATLAFIGVFNPLPVPLAGLHKFYVGQPFWGGVYILLGWTQIPRVASAIEGVWYLIRCRQATVLNQPQVDFSDSPGCSPPEGLALSQQTQAIAAALRELEQLRQEGLVSEHEFEQSRRALLSKLS